MKHCVWIFALCAVLAGGLFLACDQKDEFEVHYNKNGAEVGEAPTDDDSPYSDFDIVVVKGNEGNLQRNRYRFGGWTVQGDDSGKIYSEGDRITINAADILFDVHWVEDDSVTIAVASYSVNHYQQNIDDDEYTLFHTDTQKGVVGQKTEAKANEYTGFVAKTFEQQEITAGGDVAVNIYYDRVTVKISFNVNAGGDGVSVNLDDVAYKYKKEIAVSTDNVGTRSGYTFLGWAKDASATLPDYAVGGKITVGTENLMLYAVWQADGTVPDETDGDENDSGDE